MVSQLVGLGLDLCPAAWKERTVNLHGRSGSVALPRTKEVPASEATRDLTEPARRAARTVGVVRKSEVAMVSDFASLLWDRFNCCLYCRVGSIEIPLLQLKVEVEGEVEGEVEVEAIAGGRIGLLERSAAGEEPL